MFQKENIFNDNNNIKERIKKLDEIEKRLTLSLARYYSKNQTKLDKVIEKFIKEKALVKSRYGDKASSDIVELALNIYQYIIENDLEGDTLDDSMLKYFSIKETNIESKYSSKDTKIETEKKILEFLNPTIRSEFSNCSNKVRRVALYEKYLDKIKEAIKATNCLSVADFLNSQGLKSYLRNNHKDFFKEYVSKNISYEIDDLVAIEEWAKKGETLKTISEYLDMPYQSFLQLIWAKFPKGWYRNIREGIAREKAREIVKILGQELIEEIIKSPQDKYQILIKPDNFVKLKKVIEKTGTYYITKVIPCTQSELSNFFKRKDLDWWNNYKKNNKTKNENGED